MVNAKEKPVNINRHINGVHLSPNIRQDFHNHIPVLEESPNFNKKVFLYKHQQNESLAVEFKSQYPPIFKSLQKTEVYPENKVLKDGFRLGAECDRQAFNKLFKTGNQHCNFFNAGFYATQCSGN